MGRFYTTKVILSFKNTDGGKSAICYELSYYCIEFVVTEIFVWGWVFLYKKVVTLRNPLWSGEGETKNHVRLVDSAVSKMSSPRPNQANLMFSPIYWRTRVSSKSVPNIHFIILLPFPIWTRGVVWCSHIVTLSEISIWLNFIILSSMSFSFFNLKVLHLTFFKHLRSDLLKS